MQYLVTTKPIPVEQPVIMVDGTVLGWNFKPGDRHFDHHRHGGAKIQIDEIPENIALSLQGNEVMVTTQVDADACVAAAWCQIAPQVTPQQKRQLRAIAYDCDHLIVPHQLQDLTDFAAQAVASMKQASFELVAQMGLPPARKQWTEEQRIAYASNAFAQGSQWIIAAIKGERPFPGEQGEAREYWEQVQRQTQQLITEERIIYLPTPQGIFPVCDTRSMGGYIDPRCFLRALKPLPNLLPMTLTVRDFKSGGDNYTLGCIPDHPQVDQLDYTISTLTTLTTAERAKNPHSEPWGGRATVGGSPWNNASQLTIEEVVAISSATNPIDFSVSF